MKPATRINWNGHGTHVVDCHWKAWSGVLALSLLVLSGCSTWKVPDQLKWDAAVKQDLPVARIVPMWSDTVLHETDRPGVRGFAARIYFYPHEATDPVKVDGSLTVYAFDSQRYDRHNAKPEKKFVFTAEQFANHHSKTKLGHSYSVWLPWDEVGGETRHITLISKFRATNGMTVISDPTRKLLPGISPTIFESGNTEDYPVSQVGYDEPTTRQHERPKPALSLDLPPTFSRGLLRDRRVTDMTGRAVQPIGQPRSATHGDIVTDPRESERLVQEESLEELPTRQRLRDRFERQRHQARSSPADSRAFLPFEIRPAPSERPYVVPPIR